MKAWVDKIKSVDGGSIDVEKRDLSSRSPGSVILSKPRTAVAHTIEGSHIDLSWANGVPTIAIGPHSRRKRPVIQQLLPFGAMGSALANPSGGVETNRWALVQVEEAAFSAREAWLPSKEQQIIYASFMEFCEDELGIPEHRPFPDDPGDGILATTSYPRRHAGKWGQVAGWYKHLEVPENHHWDSGGEQLRAMLRREYPPDFMDAYQLMVVWKPDDLDHRKVVALGPHFERKSDLRKWLVKEGQVRWTVWNHLRQGHRIRIAKRRVKETQVRIR